MPPLPDKPPNDDVPASLRRCFACLKFILKETHDAIILVGIIVLTAVAIYSFVSEKALPKGQPDPQPAKMVTKLP